MKNVTNFILLSVPSEQNETFARCCVKRIPVEIFGRSKTRPVPCERSLSIPTQKIHKIQNQRSFPTEELRNVLKEVDYLHQKAREKIPKIEANGKENQE